MIVKVFGLVFGGCCTYDVSSGCLGSFWISLLDRNVWTYEELLLLNPRIGTLTRYPECWIEKLMILLLPGSALTFSQMLFITLHSLPSFLSFSNYHTLPRLKPRQVPLGQWGLQVLVLTTGSLLNNWVFAYKVPLTVQIVFRSGSAYWKITRPSRSSCLLGLAVSMLFGYLFLGKSYNRRQMVSRLR